jgi:hypothetical protein
MDPNETLKKIRELLKVVFNNMEDFQMPQVAIDLADEVTALDSWITSGGFLPDAWKPRP